MIATDQVARIAELEAEFAQLKEIRMAIWTALDASRERERILRQAVTWACEDMAKNDGKLRVSTRTALLNARAGVEAAQ